MEKGSRVEPIDLSAARPRAQSSGEPYRTEGEAPIPRRSGAQSAGRTAPDSREGRAETPKPAQKSRSADAGRRSAAPAGRQTQQRRAEPEVYNFSYQRKDAERRARIRRNRIILLAGVVLLVVAVIGIRMALTLGAGMNTFYEGVSVDGLRLKGYSKEEAVERLAAFNAKRLDGMTVTLKYGDREWTVTPEELGASLDIQEQVENAWEQGRTGSIFARQAQVGDLKRKPYAAYTTISYDGAVLEQRLLEVKNAIDLPAKDASMDFDTSRDEMFKMIPEEQGREVDLAILMDQAIARLNEGIGGVIEVKPTPVEPKIYEAQLRSSVHRVKRVTTPLGSSKAERIHNIKLALSFFDGMTVMPGEEVSFNKTTGSRNLEDGYQNAGVILDDEIVDGPGGGVCQVSTTLYQALVQSGIEIVSRSKHSLPVSYVEKGTDAAVAYDSKDLVFRNNTDLPIYLECRVSSGSNVSVTVYGRALEAGEKIEIVSELFETTPAPEPDIIPDTAGQYVKYTDETFVKKPSKEGYKVRTYAVTMKDGTEVSRKQLSNDHYRAVKGTTYVGVTPRPAKPADAPVITGDGD